MMRSKEKTRPRRSDDRAVRKRLKRGKPKEPKSGTFHKCRNFTRQATQLLGRRGLTEQQTVDMGQRRTHALQKRGSAAVLVQAAALLINHIAPGRRTLAPSA